MHKLALIIFLGCSLVAAGCGPSGGGPPVDPEEAVKCLRKGLDAWKEGAEPESLQSQSPPIWLNEPEWKNGAKLLDYKLETPTMQGRQARVQAALSMQSKAGKKMQQNIAYIVDITPRCVITREEF